LCDKVCTSDDDKKDAAWERIHATLPEAVYYLPSELGEIPAEYVRFGWDCGWVDKCEDTLATL
jgi:hypothetical protein